MSKIKTLEMSLNSDIVFEAHIYTSVPLKSPYTLVYKA